MERIRDLLKQIEINLTPMNKKNKVHLKEIKSINLWGIYAADVNEESLKMLELLDFSFLPELKGSHTVNSEILRELNFEVDLLKEIIRKANYPCKGCCGKRYSCFCCFKETFSTFQQ
jgi:hypothetical protein